MYCYKAINKCLFRLLRPFWYARLAGNIHLAFATAVADALIRSVGRLASGPLERMADGMIFALEDTTFNVNGICRAHDLTFSAHDTVLEGVAVFALSSRQYCVGDHAAETACHALLGDKALRKTKGAETGGIGGMALGPVGGRISDPVESGISSRVNCSIPFFF